MKKFTKTPRGKVVDGSGQPRREGYSKSSHCGSLGSHGSSAMGSSESKGLSRSCLFIDLLGSDLNEALIPYDFDTLFDSTAMGFSKSKGLLRNCPFIDLLGSDLNELVLGVTVTVSPCGQGGGPPVHAVIDVHLLLASVLGSSGPGVDLVGNTGESVRGVLGGVSTFL